MSGRIARCLRFPRPGCAGASRRSRWPGRRSCSPLGAFDRRDEQVASRGTAPSLTECGEHKSAGPQRRAIVSRGKSPAGERKAPRAGLGGGRGALSAPQPCDPTSDAQGSGCDIDAAEVLIAVRARASSDTDQPRATLHRVLSATRACLNWRWSTRRSRFWHPTGWNRGSWSQIHEATFASLAARQDENALSARAASLLSNAPLVRYFCVAADARAAAHLARAHQIAVELMSAFEPAFPRM